MFIILGSTQNKLFLLLQSQIQEAINELDLDDENDEIIDI